MTEEYLEELNQLKKEVKEMDGSDPSKLSGMGENTCTHIEKCMKEAGESSESSLKILKECLEKLADIKTSDFNQFRTDVLFALDLCIHVVKNRLAR